MRRDFLLSEGPINRREWIELRLQELAEIFAIAVAGFSVMDNHLHVLAHRPRRRRGLIRRCPIEDLRELDSSREGMLKGFSPGTYLLLVGYTPRSGKTSANWIIQRKFFSAIPCPNSRASWFASVGTASHPLVGTAQFYKLTGLELLVPRAHIQRSAVLTWSSAGGINEAECGWRES